VSGHIAALCRTGFYQLRQIRPAIRSLTTDAAKTIVQAFIACRLDWCNSLLYGVPENLLRKVQSVQNAAARLLTNTRRRVHITPVLRQLHWLPVERRVKFKIACLAHQSITSLNSTDIPILPTFNSSLSMVDRSFAVAGPHVWNSVPATIRQITSNGQFRQHLKTHLFRA